MAKKKTFYDHLLKNNKLPKGLPNTPMWNLIEHVNKVMPYKSNTGMYLSIQKMQEFANSISLPQDHFLKLHQLNVNPLVSTSIHEIIKTIDNRLLESPFLIDSSFKSETEDVSVVELELNSFDEAEAEKEEITKIIDTTPKIIKSIYEDDGVLKIIDPRKFEEVVAELLYAKGFEVQLTKRTKDGGYDVIALTKAAGFPFKMIVECKRHKKTVGIDIVRSFCDVISTSKPNKGLIVTTSYFSPTAKKRKEQMGAMLDLQDRDDLLYWIMEYMVNNQS